MSTEQERIDELEKELQIMTQRADEHYNKLIIVEARYNQHKTKNFYMKVEIQVLNKAILRRNGRLVKSRGKIKELEKQIDINARIISGKNAVISGLQNKLFNIKALQEQEV